MMKIRLSVAVILIELWARTAAGQSDVRDSTSAYERAFCLSFGAALPFLHYEKLHVPYMTESEEEYSMVVEELWKNAFTRVGTVRHRVLPILVSYCPTSRIELGLGYWSRSVDGADAGDAGYSTSSQRVFLNVLFRPPVSFSRKLRPVLGLCLARDAREQDYVDLFSGFYAPFNCATRTLSVSAVLGAHMSAGRMIFGLEVNALGLCYVQGDWTYQGTKKTFEHLLGPSGILENGFLIGPVAGRIGYTF